MSTRTAVGVLVSGATLVATMFPGTALADRPTGGGRPASVEPGSGGPIGDRDGDLHIDVAVRTVLWGESDSDLPISGDFDGDGRADIAIHRSTTSPNEFWVERSSDGQLLFRRWGEPDDLSPDYYYAVRSLVSSN